MWKFDNSSCSSLQLYTRWIRHLGGLVPISLKLWPNLIVTLYFAWISSNNIRKFYFINFKLLKDKIAKFHTSWTAWPTLIRTLFERHQYYVISRIIISTPVVDLILKWLIDNISLVSRYLNNKCLIKRVWQKSRNSSPVFNS